MEALKQKWNSCRGASILLALLFLLVCMMVGASVVMAADSNAGKIRSNKEEQQKYLTISSALNLLVDELENVQYVGKYTYKQETWQTYEYDPETDSSKVKDTHIKDTYEQMEGELSKIGGTQWELEGTDTAAGVLPLSDDLDKIFADIIEKDYVQVNGNCNCTTGGDYDHTNHYRYTKQVPSTGPYTLTFSVDKVDGLSETVIITVEMQSDGRIYLKAYLKDDPTLRMRADLVTLDGNGTNVLTLENNGNTLISGSVDNGTYRTPPVKWTLNEIVKETGTVSTPEGEGGGSDGETP